MPGFPALSPKAVDAHRRTSSAPARHRDVARTRGAHDRRAQRYRFTGYKNFLDPDGYPAIAPPWGTLNAIDLNTGEYAWQIPLGEYPELAAQGMKDTGSENYGGPIVTAGGLVFIGATSYDKKFRAFDKTTGALLWEATLPFSAATRRRPPTRSTAASSWSCRRAAARRGGPSRRVASTSRSPCRRGSEPIRVRFVVFRSGRIPPCST